MTGCILRIEKSSIHDGDGIRTVIFLKGCPMRCAWCASPESQNPQIESSYGLEMTTLKVINEIAKDEVFYFHSGGGVTISGGEPLSQPDFTLDILKACKKMGISTALETCAFGEYGPFEKIIPYLDVIYADIKLMDDKQHIKWTEVSNKTILENIKRLSGDFNGSLRIRMPLVPGVNMDNQSISAAADFCIGLSKLDFVELLPYHRLGLDTYRKLGRKCRLESIMPPGNDSLKNIENVFKSSASGKVHVVCSPR